MIDPIGEVFSAFKRLLAILQQGQPPRGVAIILEECLRTKDILLAVHCYDLCSKIMASLSENLRLQVSSLAAALTVQTPERDLPTSTQLPTPTDTNEYGNESSDISLRADLLVCESFSQLDPLGHALASACAILRTGIKLLREIEVVLGIPQEQGVAVMGSPVSLTYGRVTHLIGFGANTLIVSQPCPETSSTCSHVDSSRAARLVAVLWDEEVNSSDCPESPKKTLAVFQRCRAEILGLAKQHSLSFYV